MSDEKEKDQLFEKLMDQLVEHDLMGAFFMCAATGEIMIDAHKKGYFHLIESPSFTDPNKIASIMTVAMDGYIDMILSNSNPN